MTAVSKTNRFFVDHVYPNLEGFAWSPYNKMRLGGPFTVLLWPVLLPLVPVTLLISLPLFVLASFVHLISLAVAAIADVSNTSAEFKA